MLQVKHKFVTILLNRGPADLPARVTNVPTDRNHLANQRTHCDIRDKVLPTPESLDKLAFVYSHFHHIEKYYDICYK